MVGLAPAALASVAPDGDVREELMKGLLTTLLLLVEFRARSEPLHRVGNVMFRSKNIGAFWVKELYEAPEVYRP